MITKALPRIALIMIVPKINPLTTSTKRTVQSEFGLSNVVALVLLWRNDDEFSRIVAVVVVLKVEDSAAIGFAIIVVGGVYHLDDVGGLW